MRYFYDKFWMLMIMAFLEGIAIGIIDTSPNWDDTGVTVGLIFVFTGVLGFLGNRNLWVLAIIVGFCITLFNFYHDGNLGSAISFLIALAGVYTGRLIHLKTLPANVHL